MKVFVAGSTGALGKQLVPMLVANGHDVVGMTRTESKRDQLRRVGAQPVVADALDADAVGRAVGEAEPDVIVHQLTAIPQAFNPRRFDRAFALTNRLRIEGTDNLLSAGQAAGVKRFVAQSNAGVPYARTGGPIKAEDAPLDDDPPAVMRQGLDAIRHLEAAVTGARWTEGLVLRYGWFYGPGTSVALHPPGSQIELLRKRQFPIVGGGTGVLAFVHIEDAATATVAAVGGGPAGIYNVVDDEPAPVSDVLPVLAAAVGAKRPLRVPAWVARLAGGKAAGMLMTEVRGASNDKAKRELGRLVVLDFLLTGDRLDLTQLICGSEGTLAIVTEATVGLVPTPKVTAIAVGQFASTQDAIAATPDAMASDPAQVELLDRYILDLARQQQEFAGVTELFDGDPSALLYVTFYGDDTAEVAARMDELAGRWADHGHGYATVRATTAVASIIEKVIEANDKPRAEIVVDVEILEVNRDRAKEFGLDLSQYALGGIFSPEVAPPNESSAPNQVGSPPPFTVARICSTLSRARW